MAAVSFLSACPANGQEALGKWSVRATAVSVYATPMPLATIPAGWFLMGSPRLDLTFGLATPYDNTEIPQRRIWVDGYMIDQYEVSVAQYLKWAITSSLSMDAMDTLFSEAASVSDKIFAVRPMGSVTWFEADRFCRSQGKRLPTEAEWEKAARGTDGRLFPWGDAPPDQKLAVFDRSSSSSVELAAVDSLSAGRSPYGLHHMAGNVAEWVQDWNGIDWYVIMPERNPQGPSSGRYRVIRGGSWRSPPVMLRAATRNAAEPARRSPTIGFRCAASTSTPDGERTAPVK